MSQHQCYHGNWYMGGLTCFFQVLLSISCVFSSWEGYIHFVQGSPPYKTSCSFVMVSSFLGEAVSTSWVLVWVGSTSCVSCLPYLGICTVARHSKWWLLQSLSQTRSLTQGSHPGVSPSVICQRVYRIAENFQREKTFANFAVLWLYAKVFSVKFGAQHPLARQKRAICESFLRENLPIRDFRYTVIISLDTIVTLEAPKGTMLFDIGLVRTLSQTLTGCEAKFSVGYIVFTPYSFKDASLTSEDYLQPQCQGLPGH